MPAFLQSDSYLEFRLAKLVSQVEVGKPFVVPVDLFHRTQESTEYTVLNTQQKVKTPRDPF